jgi:hypothetical protein
MTSKKILLWLVPILITVHNLEEAGFMPAVLARRNSAVPNLLHGLVPPITYGQFLLALLIMTAIPYLIAWFAIRERERVGPGLLLLVSVQVMMLVNVFAHAGMAILIGGYAPGLVTATAINLPFSIYLLHHAVRERWVSGKAMALIVPVGLVLHGIGLPMIIILSGKIVNGL